MRAIAIAFLCSTAAWAQEPPAMTATYVEGMVTARGTPVLEGDVLREGDLVVTQPGARVEISLSTGSVIRMGESSRLTLGKVQPGKSFSAKLFLGNLWTKVHKLLSAETFHIETENGVAGVRGTEFRVEAAEGKEDVVRVYEGVVEVRGHDGKWLHRIEPGSELRFHRDRPPAGPRAFDRASDSGDKFMHWVRSRPKEPRQMRPPVKREPKLEQKHEEKLREKRKDRH
jgi:ferric-dicitrate binding protein FerR (iron transport regulator)